MAMSQSGDVTTADNCQIINNSYGAVRVKSLAISTVNGWKLTAFGDKSTELRSNTASEKVDSNKLGFAGHTCPAAYGDGEWAVTDSSDEFSQMLISAPIAGCYMSGIGGEVTPTKLNVVVPTSLPMAMSDDGSVVTADNCRIIK